jgi:hypothetical protein
VRGSFSLKAHFGLEEIYERWIEMKYALYNINNDQHAKLEMCLDTDSQGANGCARVKVLEYTDDGIWTAPAPGCSFPDNDILMVGNSVVFIRNFAAAEGRYKWFSVREIQAVN